MKIVIDANILISLYASKSERSKYWPILSLHELYISPEIFTEVERNLRQVEFRLSHDDIKLRLLDALDRCILLRPKLKYDGIIPDEKDRHVATLAMEIKADIILTGDHALQKMNNIAGAKVVSLARFSEDFGLDVKQNL